MKRVIVIKKLRVFENNFFETNIPIVGEKSFRGTRREVRYIEPFSRGILRSEYYVPVSCSEFGQKCLSGRRQSVSLSSRTESPPVVHTIFHTFSVRATLK